MRKLALVVAVVLTACALAAVVGIISYETTKTTTTLALLKSSDICLPDGLKEEEFGLFFYDNDGKLHRADSGAPFDAKKPLVVLSYALAQGMEDDGADTYSQWQALGYNVGTMIWHQLSEDDIAAAEEKIWTAGGAFIQRKVYGGYAKEHLPYAVAECMTAYYLDFMAASGFEGGEIRFVGHSVGAQLITAVTSYLLTLEQNGFINEDCLPDRLTLLDGVYTNNLSKNYISWLEKPLEGSVFLAADTVKALKSKGGAVEYVRSSFIDMYTQTGGGKTAELNQLTNLTTYLELRSDWIDYDGNQPVLSSLTKKHLFARNWYTAALAEPLPVDYSSESSVQYGLSPNTPTSYTRARAGTKYLMQINMTQDCSDDRQYSINSRVPLVSGFAAIDDGEGCLDSRLKNRVDGVRVELYLVSEGGDRLITSATTKNGGFYQLPIEPIYIFNTPGKEFYIVIKPPQGYTVSKKAGCEGYFLMKNDINQDEKSHSFFIYNTEQLKIINIGLTHN